MNPIKLLTIAATSLLFVSCNSKPADNTKENRTRASEANQRGITHFEEGEYKDARKYFFEAAEEPNLPDSTRGIYMENIADAYARDGLHDSALVFYNKAGLQFKPGSVRYYTNKAFAFFQVPAIDSALQVLLTAYKIDSNNSTVNNHLGLIYLGEYDKAFFDPEKAYRYNNKAWKLSLDSPTKCVLAKNEYYLNRTERALALFRQLHLEFPKDRTYLISLILIKGELGDEQDMDLLKKQLKEYFPDDYKSTLADIVPGSHTITWIN